MSQLLDFYRETATDAEGRMFAEILSWPDDDLEAAHDFIQWLFPLPEPSRFNPDAPLLTDDDIASFYREPKLKQNLQKAFDRILAFLGLARLDDHISEGPNFGERRADVWESPNHNWLRISRILRCLTLLGLTSETTLFFQWLEAEYTRRRFPISAETFGYWHDALNG